jgi:hypothetical protein
MWLSDKWADYELIDCSGGEKLERWGEHVLVRPDPQAIWDTPRDNAAGTGATRGMRGRPRAAANGMSQAACRSPGGSATAI